MNTTSDTSRSRHDKFNPNVRSTILSQAVIQSLDGVALLDAAGIVKYVNPAFERMSGFLAAELVGMPLPLLRNNTNSDDFYDSIKQTVRQGSSWSGRLSCRKKNGDEYWVLSQITPLYDERRASIIAYVLTRRDITAQYHMATELKRVRTELKHVQRLESIGQFAGGIAHEFNNMLQGILGFAELVELRAQNHPAILTDIRQVLNIVKKAKNLTRQLLVFSRKQVINLANTDLNACIRQLQPQLSFLLGTEHAVSMDLSHEVPAVLVDTTLFEQAIINLLINARDAVAHRATPKILISSKDVVISPDTMNADETDILPGRYTVVSVTDNGTGIPQEHQHRIFDPFFTTKPKTKGTGLGLSVVYGIMAQHNGYVILFSEPGKGTTFSLYFPAFIGRTTMLETARETSPPPSTSLAGSFGDVSPDRRMILLVEDDPDVAHIAEEHLRLAGFTMVMASTEEEALSLYAANKDRICLLFTDIILASGNGVHLADAVRTEDPNLPVLLTSGFSDDSLKNRSLRRDRYMFLPKPYNRMGLLHSLRKSLDGDSEPLYAYGSNLGVSPENKK